MLGRNVKHDDIVDADIIDEQLCGGQTASKSLPSGHAVW